MSHTLKKCNICTFVSTKTSNVKRHMKRHDQPKLEPVGPLHCPNYDTNIWKLLITLWMAMKRPET